MPHSLQVRSPVLKPAVPFGASGNASGVPSGTCPFGNSAVPLVATAIVRTDGLRFGRSTAFEASWLASVVTAGRATRVASAGELAWLLG